MGDKPFRVTWKAGQIIVYALSQERAVDVALAYIKQPSVSRMLVEPSTKEGE